MAYERLLFQHVSKYFEPKQGNQFHEDVSTFSNYTLASCDIADLEYERQYQADMLDLIREIRDELDEDDAFDQDYTLDDMPDEFPHIMRDSYSPSRQWVEGRHDKFNPPDPWEHYPFDEEDDWEEPFEFDGEDEFFQGEEQSLPVDADLANIRQAERMAASLRRYQQGRRQ